MKAVMFLGLLTFAFSSAVIANVDCDPDGNGKPVCVAENVGRPYRNFWDPTAYWLCRKAGAEAELVRCPSGKLFDAARGKCIPANQWIWTYPCPDKQYIVFV
ncbi:uncharacterized protein LOC119601106 isoform X2 [Lucilia sericata]|uniref:uncharacterized protein LOC119601106 isoform X2 n=1 Tax=Lucilia sericata TaxID=13632 RepID=UPI0018A7F7B8|nr:uncharacterized protein LOC119601106 isoform X2 [Lucilia sericata]